MLVSHLFASNNPSIEQIRELMPYLAPAGAFLFGCLLTWMIMRASERAAVARLEERLEAANEAKSAAAERASLLQRELDGAWANEARLLRQQGQLEGQLRAEQRHGQSFVAEEVAAPVEPPKPPVTAKAEPKARPELATSTLPTAPKVEIAQNEASPGAPEGEFALPSPIPAKKAPVQQIFGGKDEDLEWDIDAEESLPQHERPGTLEEYLAQAKARRDAENASKERRSPDAKGAAAELRAALEKKS